MRPLSEIGKGALIRRGAVAIVVVVAAISVAVGGARLPFTPPTPASLGLPVGTRSVCAEFTDAVGLYEGNDVSMLGVTVGRISTIAQREEYVEVTMTIPDDFALPADVGAVIVSSSIVTDRRVEFTKPYAGGARYTSNACIPLARTRTPKGVSDVLDGINRIATELLGGSTDEQRKEGQRQLQEFVNNADSIVAGSGAQFNKLLAALSELIGDPASKDASMRRLVDSLSELTGMFVTNWPDFQKVLDRLREISQLIEGSTNGLGQAVGYANDFLPVIARNIEKYDEQLYGIADALVPFAHGLLSRMDDIGALLDYLPAAIRKAPGLVDPMLLALQFSYKSPRFETSVGGETVQLNFADLLGSVGGGR